MLLIMTLAHYLMLLTSVPRRTRKACCCTSRAYYGNLNFFGGPSTTSVKASAKLKQLEEENEDAMFVVLSDVWLDSVEVMEKIHTMFSGMCFVCLTFKGVVCIFCIVSRIHFCNRQHHVIFGSKKPHYHHETMATLMQTYCVCGVGYATMPPTCFIFCGNFSSAPYGKTQIKSLKGKRML